MKTLESALAELIQRRSELNWELRVKDDNVDGHWKTVESWPVNQNSEKRIMERRALCADDLGCEVRVILTESRSVYMGQVVPWYEYNRKRHDALVQGYAEYCQEQLKGAALCEVCKQPRLSDELACYEPVTVCLACWVQYQKSESAYQKFDIMNKPINALQYQKFDTTARQQGFSALVLVGLLVGTVTAQVRDIMTNEKAEIIRNFIRCCANLAQYRDTQQIWIKMADRMLRGESDPDSFAP